MRHSYDGTCRNIPMTDSERQRITDRIAAEDAERDRNARGWARLCGMAAPIGGPSVR